MPHNYLVRYCDEGNYTEATFPDLQMALDFIMQEINEMGMDDFSLWTKVPIEIKVEQTDA